MLTRASYKKNKKEFNDCDRYKWWREVMACYKNPDNRVLVPITYSIMLENAETLAFEELMEKCYEEADRHMRLPLFKPLDPCKRFTMEFKAFKDSAKNYAVAEIAEHIGNIAEFDALCKRMLERSENISSLIARRQAEI